MDGEDHNRMIEWEEITKHSSREDEWLVIDGGVYDVTRWADKHPGGRKLIGFFGGQDATSAFKAFHKDQKFVRKFLAPLKVGNLSMESRRKRDPIDVEFDELRETAVKMGLFQSSKFFYFMQFAQFVVYEVAAYYILKVFGIGWIPLIASMFVQATAQITASWTQHDFGHRSVSKTHKSDRLMHQLVMNFAKGASANWWNHLHYQHHAKPNVINKDPDVRMEILFVVGDTMPEQIAKRWKFSLPYNFQQSYFFVIGPPLLFPVYFQIMTFRYVITRRLWMDLFLMFLFYCRFVYTLYPVLGFGWLLFYLFGTRMIESHWFTWVTQSNHIPMKIDDDKGLPWMRSQLFATCNLEKSFFNDWFTGHLNFQIEHHLFPMMPRHNCYKVAPLVQKLCERHNIDYQVKPLVKAFCDIVRALRHSGELWHAAYHAYHLD